MATLTSVRVSSASYRGGEELECYTEDAPSFTALRSTRDLRARIMPPRRAPSLPQLHELPLGSFRQRLGRGSPRGKDLMAECKMMLRKNQSWLSMEDLTTPSTPEVEETPAAALGIDRRSGGGFLGTIPDTAPATLTTGLPQCTPEASVLLLPTAQETREPTTPASPLGASAFFQEQERDTSGSPGFSYTLESSGTLTPASDATLSPGQSVETLSTSPKSSVPSPSSASFAMHRGDSVDGLFMTSSPAPEPQEVVAPPSLTHQSPFRRQLFTSLVTHQSALVSRVNQHSTRLLEVVGVVTQFTQKETTTPAAHSTPKRPQEAPGYTYAASPATLGPESPPTPCDEPQPAPQEPVDAGEEAWAWGEVHQEAAVPFLGRAASRRHLSICDSGLGFDTDDELVSLSRSSTYTTSDDGEEVIDREGEYKCDKGVLQEY